MKHRFTMVMMALLVIASFTLVNAENYIHPVKAQKYETSLMDYKTTPEAYLDWTEGFANYYLSSGAAADTFAVYFKPTGTGIILNSIEMKWYDGDGATNVLVYAWEIGPDCPPSGLASDIDDTLHVHVLGDVLAGPIPFAPVAGYDWQGFELSDFSGDIPIGGDGDPVPFFLGFVKLGALPQPLAADVTNYLSEEINHTFIKGPN
ncbi:MAG: hypothetical protein KAR38_04700, partial [Calditrichia bacterium]|nr:hypothetical protein [Calditrichia bacterium]